MSTYRLLLWSFPPHLSLHQQIDQNKPNQVSKVKKTTTNFHIQQEDLLFTPLHLSDNCGFYYFEQITQIFDKQNREFIQYDASPVPQVVMEYIMGHYFVNFLSKVSKYTFKKIQTLKNCLQTNKLPTLNSQPI